MPISYIYAGNPTVGTDDDDFIFPMLAFTGTDNNSITAGAGDDLVIGDSGYIFTPGASQHNGSLASAFSLDFIDAWTTGENPLFGNDSIPHATAICETTIDEIEVYSLTLTAGQAVTVDIDFGDSDIGVSEDFRIEVVDINGSVVGSNDNSAITDGGLGSTSGNDPYVTFTAPLSRTYYIRVTRADGTAFTTNATFVLNVSVAGHAVSAPTVGNDVINGGDGNDTLLGQANSDTLIGGNGFDTLHGGSGDDILEGGADADILIGGTGIDTASYANSTTGVFINLSTGVAVGGDAENDILSSIEVLVGSGFGDILQGDSAANTLRGGGGE